MKKVLAALVLGLSGFGASAQLNTDHILQVGRHALYFEDYLVALRHFNDVIALKPYLAEPYYLRAIAKYSLEDFVGAEADAVKATEIHPYLPEAWEVRAVANQCLGRNGEAIAAYDHALELLPFNRQMLFNKALAQEADKRWAEADSTYSTLLRVYPAYDPGYVGRAQLRLQQGDTIGAVRSLADALRINPNSVEALTLRASLRRGNPAGALADMERAVTLQPDRAYLRVNRAVARYLNHDYNGALSDFDYVLQLDPMNYTALLNRALIRAEIKDNDRALTDFNRVLELRPDDVGARFNRAVVEQEKGMLKEALEDAERVVSAYPQMYAAYVLRGQIHEQAGRKRAAEADFRRAMAIAHSENSVTDGDAPAGSDTSEMPSAQETINRFRALRTVNDNTESTAQTFNTEGLRGRVQDRRARIEPLSIYQLSYYTTANSPGVYSREIEDLNSAHVLPMVVYLTHDLPALTTEADVALHVENIKRLSPKSALDYFRRAMDRMTLRDYPGAIADLDSLVGRQPDFAPGYLMRAAARYRLRESQQGRVLVNADINALNAEAALTFSSIMADLDSALDHDPRMAAAAYNRGVLLMQMGRMEEALEQFTRAIGIDPNLGPAYFNRGYIRFSQGNSAEATADLSRAGQLGVTEAYPLLKQMSVN